MTARSRSGARTIVVLMVAWRGTDSKEDAQLDVQSVNKVPWHNREEVAAKHGTLVGVAGAKGPDRHLQRGEANDPSVSPLPHYGLLKRTLMVGKGFLTQYLGEQLSARVKRVVAEQLKSKAVGYEVLICGHSLGGAVATLCAYELACQYLKTSILLVTFGSPRTVNTEFANVLSRLPNLRCYRVANEYDVVSRVPPYFLDFQHVGKFIWIRGATCGRRGGLAISRGASCGTRLVGHVLRHDGGGRPLDGALSRPFGGRRRRNVQSLLVVAVHEVARAAARQ